MIKKRKIGTLLILVGIGIPLILFFFQDLRGDLVLVKTIRELKYTEKVLDPKNPDDAKRIKGLKILGELDQLIPWIGVLDKEEITYTSDKKTGLVHMRWDYYYDIKRRGFEIPCKYFIALGIILTLIGAGMITFSFFPKESKKK